jgi:hypothetical protein
MKNDTLYDMLVGVLWVLIVFAGLQFLVWWVRDPEPDDHDNASR